MTEQVQANPEPAASPVEAATAVPVTPAASVAAPVAEAPAAEAAPVTASRPEGVPDAYWDEAAGAVKPEAYSRLAELEAAEASRREGVPESPDKYELKPAAPVLGLDGQPVEFDAADPLAKAMLEVFHKHNGNQALVSDALAAFATLEVQSAKAQSDALAAEVAKIENHGPRVEATRNALAAAVGADKAEALLGVLGNADAFFALEALIKTTNGPAISAAPPASPHGDFDGLHGAELLTAARARKAG